MGFFTRSTSKSKQTARLKSLAKLAVARLAVVRRPRLGRRSIARGDVAQLLSIGHLHRALARAEQVIEEDGVLEALDIIEHCCQILIDHSAQLEKPKECGEEIKAAAAGLIFASARCGELPELLDARAILANKFGRDFERAAKDGSQVVVSPTLVQRLSGEKANEERQWRLAKEIAAENDILLDFPDNPRQVHQSKQSEQAKNVPVPVPAEKSVEQFEVKTETAEVRRRQRLADDNVSRSNLAQARAEEKASRESKKYDDVRMAAEAAFESASFAAMAARAAVELSRTESQGKGWRGGGGGDKVHPLQNCGVTQRETRPPGKPQKPPSPSPSPSWSDKSTVSSVWSDAPVPDAPAAPKGKSIVFDQSDEEDDDVVEDLVWVSQLRRPPYGRTASAMGVDGAGGNTHGVRRAPQPFQDVVPNGSEHAQPAHRRYASELAGGGDAHREATAQLGQYRAPPYRRNPAADAGSNGEGRRSRREDEGGAYESSAYVARAPYARIASTLEGGNEHIARHEDVRRIGTDARVLQEKVYGAAGGAGRVPLTPERRAISVRTRR